MCLLLCNLSVIADVKCPAVRDGEQCQAQPVRCYDSLHEETLTAAPVSHISRMILRSMTVVLITPSMLLALTWPQ